MKKDNQIIINIEEPLFEAFTRLAALQGKSNSAVGRQLIIDELQDRGLFPNSMALDVLRG